MLSLPAPPPWLRRTLAALVPLAVAVVFLPAIGNGFVAWDDDVTLLDHHRWRGLSPAHLAWMFTTLHAGHWQPLTWVTFAVDHALWGLDPRGYHLTSLVLHALATLAFWRVLVRLLAIRDGRAGTETPTRLAAAAIGALAFGLHPLRVESVAWASERRDVLSGLFWLLTVLAYLRVQTAPARRRAWRVASVTAFTLSLLAKAWGITLPVVLLVLDVWPLRRLPAVDRRTTLRILREKLPWALLAGTAAVVAFVAQRRVDAMRTLAEHGLVERAAQAAYGLVFYVWKTLVPRALSPLYLLPPEIDPLAPRFALSALAVIAITATLVGLRRRAPWALAAWVTYGVIVSPVLGIAQTGPQLVADRYSYLACLPFAALLAGAMERALDARPRLTLGLALVLLGALGGLTARQIRIWHDSQTLWQHALAIDPTNHVAWTNRGWARHTDGDLTGAIADYTEAIRLWPHYALPFKNRGFARQLQGDLRGAIEDYTRAVTLEPDHAEAWYDRGTAWQALGDPRRALADYTEAIRHDPGDPRPFNNRGLVRRDLGDRAGARADFERALVVAEPSWPARSLVEGNLRTLGR